MRDRILEVWLRLLALHIADPEQGSIGQQIREGWLLASRGYFLGMSQFDLKKPLLLIRVEE